MSKPFYYIIFLIFISCGLSAQIRIITRADSLFFVGLDNEINIQSSKIPVQKLRVEMIGGSVSGENGKYFVHCSAPTKEASIRIFHRSKLVVEKKIMVVKVSEPIAYVVGDTSVTEGLISKKHFLTFNSLIVKINVPYMGMNIIRFEVKKISNNLVADSLENVGYAFSSNLKKMLGSAMKGDVIIFKNIVSTGPDDSGIIHKEIKLTVAD